MRKWLIIYAVIFITLSASGQNRHPLQFCYQVANQGSGPVRNTKFLLQISILINSDIIYREEQTLQSDSIGNIYMEIGKGRQEEGEFDSIIWSLGDYELELAISQPGKDGLFKKEHFPIRTAENLDADHEEGSENGNGTSSKLLFPNTRGKRPKKVFLDLTTSYVNVSYPADTYPIYRHFEWTDPDQDGLGNSFTISFSENTRNALTRNTRLAGDVTLYAIPFQQLIINAQPVTIGIELTDPVPVKSHGRTYEIRGPWMLIWYFEW